MDDTGTQEQPQSGWKPKLVDYVDDLKAIRFITPEHQKAAIELLDADPDLKGAPHQMTANVHTFLVPSQVAALLKEKGTFFLERNIGRGGYSLNALRGLRRPGYLGQHDL